MGVPTSEVEETEEVKEIEEKTTALANEAAESNRDENRVQPQTAEPAPTAITVFVSTGSPYPTHTFS